MLRRTLAIHFTHLFVPRLPMSTISNNKRTTTKTPTPVVKGSVGPPLRTFTDAAATPETCSRILPAIKHDHQELESHSHKILQSTKPEEQTRFQNKLVWELARHMAGEELVVYPALIDSLKEGQQTVDRNRLEHQGVKKQLKMFQDLSSTDPRFVPTLKNLLRDFEIHARHEEDVDLPMLEDVLSKDESVALTKSLDRTKMLVPSRSHPLLPNKPPFETAAGLMAAPLDSLTNWFRKWPGEKEDT
ncbi:uncharacterized protein N7511_010943 [Penicillium nucicola]|uniref:uncharacterized protein n=1 Tax=Penicillium nucicola TaxID=1850975 RepID=UPI002544F232|nr:uncharacterized protein N7511_010943 [Penicillium nucicola]KAJ5749247.1 hypothetical protein N7511_010943 [Penicillium nucicola]